MSELIIQYGVYDRVAKCVVSYAELSADSDSSASALNSESSHVEKDIQNGKESVGRGSCLDYDATSDWGSREGAQEGQDESNSSTGLSVTDSMGSLNSSECEVGKRGRNRKGKKKTKGRTKSVPVGAVTKQEGRKVITMIAIIFSISDRSAVLFLYQRASDKNTIFNADEVIRWGDSC